MQLTRAQLRGVWFIVIVFSISVVLHYGKMLFFPAGGYDFSELEKEFSRLADSIAASQAQVTPPVKGEKHDEAETVTWQKFPVNINAAGSEQLQYLPRIGPSMAARILEYRNQNGPFQSKEDLMNVRGIGPKTFQKLKNLITLK
jgi:comEA protein